MTPNEKQMRAFERVYEPTPDAGREEGLRLLPAEWGLLRAADGRRCALELAADLRLDPPETTAALATLEQRGLVRQSPVTLENYVRIAAAVRGFAGEPIALSTFLAGHGDQPPHPEATEPVVPPAQVPSRHESRGEPLPAFGARVPRPANAPAFRPLAPALSQQKGPRSLSIGALIRSITNRYGDPTSGQLAVYRVFMGIPTTLLRREGIHTLRFDEERFVKDPELIDSLQTAVKKNIGSDIPEEIYVATSPAGH